MKYETKFNFNDKVWAIVFHKINVPTPCPACDGEGMVTLKNGKRTCPDCYGRKMNDKWVSEEWRVGQCLTIGQVRIEHTCEFKDGDDSQFDNYGHQEEEFEEKYMCRETGVRSGTLHSADRLFASHDEAAAECASRNEIEKVAVV